MAVVAYLRVSTENSFWKTSERKLYASQKGTG